MTATIRSSLILLAVLAACSSGGSDNNNGGPTGGGDSFTATVDGTSFTATTTGAQFVSTDLSVGGQLTSGGVTKQINLYLFGISGPGTYTLENVTQHLNFGSYQEAVGSGTAESWTTSNEGSTGTMTVTSLTATKVAGSFSFSAPALTHTGATGTRTVTSGSFNVTLTPATTLRR